MDDLKWNVRIFIFKAHMKLGSQIKYFECCLTNKNTQYVIFPPKRIQFIKSVYSFTFCRTNKQCITLNRLIKLFSLINLVDIESLFNSQTKNIDNRRRFYRHIRRNRIPRELLQIITGVIVNTHEYADIIPVSFQKHPSPLHPTRREYSGIKQIIRRIKRLNK